MPNAAWDMFVSIVPHIFTAGAIYGAIRADIRNAKETAVEAKVTATGAHQRIDLHLQGHGK